MASSPSRRYQGMPADERRARRRGQLLEAGLELLGTDGWQATTVRAVCKQAGLTPRYFYESFADRDDLLVDVFRGILHDVTREVFAARPVTTGEIVRATMAAWLKVCTDDPRKGKVAFIEALGSEALMRERLSAAHVFAQALAAQIKPAGGDGAAIDTACLIAAGGLIEVMIARLNGRLDTTADQLVQNYTEMIVAGIEAAVSRSSDPAT